MTVTLCIVLPSKCLPALIFIVSGKCDAAENGLERQAQAYAETSRTFLDRNVKGSERVIVYAVVQGSSKKTKGG